MVNALVFIYIYFLVYLRSSITNTVLGAPGPTAELHRRTPPPKVPAAPPNVAHIEVWEFLTFVVQYWKLFPIGSMLIIPGNLGLRCIRYDDAYAEV